MPKIQVGRFLGIAPKIASHLLQPTQAQTARNCKLWSESLRPIDGLANLEVLSKTGTIQTLQLYNGGEDWLCWTQDVNAALGPIANDTLEKLYYTGTDYPRITTNDIWDVGTPGTSVPPSSYILGIPAPVGPPVASDDGAGNIVSSSATWVYTFVRKYSDGTIEESAPSPVSNALSLSSRDAVVTMPSGAITHANYGINYKRLYRDEGSGYFYVTEVALATASYNDNTATASLGDEIETTDDLPPPDGLLGLIALPNGCVAGFKDNVVYISRPYRPHSFPLLNQYTVHLPIVGIGNVGTSIVVCTTGRPEIGRGVDPGAYVFKRHPGKYPCISKRSIASSDLGVVWACPSGLAISDGSTVTLATRSFLTRKEWAADFAPTTLHGTVHDGRYYAWFTTGTDSDGVLTGGGIILDMNEKAFLVTLGDYAYAAHATDGSGSAADDLWVAKKNSAAANANYVYQFDADASSPTSYVWKSKLFIEPGLDNYSVAQVLANYDSELTAAEISALNAAIVAVQTFNAALTETDGRIDGFAINDGPMGGDNNTLELPALAPDTRSITFKYYSNQQLRLTKILISSDPFPLPSGRTDDLHEFELTGTADVLDVTLATSFEELR